MAYPLAYISVKHIANSLLLIAPPTYTNSNSDFQSKSSSLNSQEGDLLEML